MTARKRLVLRKWRVQDAEPSGLFVWFDPTRESVELYELEPQLEAGVGEDLEGDDSDGQSGRDQVNGLGSQPELPF